MSILKKNFKNSKDGITDLEKKIESLSKQLDDKDKTSKKKQSSLSKQMLILYYLGLLNPNNLSNIKNSKLLSVLLNADEQNIRTSLSDFIDNQLRSSAALTHLDEIASLFTELGLKEQLQKVENDIVKIKKKNSSTTA